MHSLTESELQLCLEAATKAPSIHNTQPWLFFVRPDVIEVHADLSRRLPAIDADGRALHLSLGAAILNLRIALARTGWHTYVDLLPEPDDPRHVATLHVGGPRMVDLDDRELFIAIDRRHSNRGPFDDFPPPQADLDDLAAAARAEDAWLYFADPADRDALLTLARTAEGRQRRDPAYRAELRSWTTSDPYRLDGVPLGSVGPWSALEALPIRDFAGEREVPGRTATRFELEPTIATLSVAGDGPGHWLRAGQALQRVLLEATRRGLAVSLFSQPLEDRELRRLLHDVEHHTAVQAVLRVGYGSPAPPVPRRPLEEVVILARPARPRRTGG